MVWRARGCAEAWFDHRLEFDRPVDPVDGFSRWDAEQPGILVARRVLAWETPLEVPFPAIPPRFAPSFALGLRRPPGGAREIRSPLAIRAAGADLSPVIAAASRQNPQFGPDYRTYLSWLYQGLADRGGVTFAAWAGDRVVAAATVVPGPDGDARFQEIWTDAHHRRKGLATALVHAGIRQYPDRSLLILCDEGSEALRVYLRAGFSPISRWIELSTERQSASRTASPTGPTS